MIKKLTEDNIDALVMLHRLVLGHTVNAQIGEWLLKKLYQLTLRYAHCSVFLMDNEVVGFISYCDDREAFSKEILKNISWSDKARIAWALLWHPHLIQALSTQQSFSKLLKAFPGPYILTLGVSPQHQGAGIASQLLKSLKEEVHGAVTVDTEDTNMKAISFYKKNGFVECRRAYGSVILRLER